MTAPPDTRGISVADVTAYLVSQGLPLDVPVIQARGADLQTELQQRTGAMVILTRITSAGYVNERVLTQPVFQVRSVGDQQDIPFGGPDSDYFDDAEHMAYAIDAWLMGVAIPTMFRSTRVITVQGVGGPPSILARDTGKRTHYTASYSFLVASGL